MRQPAGFEAATRGHGIVVEWAPQEKVFRYCGRGRVLHARREELDDGERVRGLADAVPPGLRRPDRARLAGELERGNVDARHPTACHMQRSHPDAGAGQGQRDKEDGEGVHIFPSACGFAAATSAGPTRHSLLRRMAPLPHPAA